MADSISIAPYFSIIVPNKLGEGAKVLSALKDAGVNMAGFWVYPIKGKKRQLDILPVDPKGFAKVAKKLGLEVASKQNTLLWTGEDRPGALAEAAVKLSEAKIFVQAAQAISAGDGHFGAMIQMAAEDIKKAKKVLSK